MARLRLLTVAGAVRALREIRIEALTLFPFDPAAKTSMTARAPVACDLLIAAGMP
jgi:hypothetical protein